MLKGFSVVARVRAIFRGTFPIFQKGVLLPSSELQSAPDDAVPGPWRSATAIRSCHLPPDSDRAGNALALPLIPSSSCRPAIPRSSLYRQAPVEFRDNGRRWAAAASTCAPRSARAFWWTIFWRWCCDGPSLPWPRRVLPLRHATIFCAWSRISRKSSARASLR